MPIELQTSQLILVRMASNLGRKKLFHCLLVAGVQEMTGCKE